MRWKIIIGFVLFVLIIILIYLYAYFLGTSGLKIKEYKIQKKFFISEYNGFKIAHISDIHYGNHISKEKIENLIEKVNMLKPDLIFITGDLVDNAITDEQHIELVNLLKKIHANINTYAVKGNHDVAYKDYEKLILEAGFINLDDKFERIYLDENNFIFLAGLSDSLYNSKSTKDRFYDIENEIDNNKNIGNCILNLLLIHEPDYIEQINYNKFDVIFSGHSHNGQVRMPIIGALYKPIGAKKYNKEYYKLDNTDLYISSGVGLSWLPIRLFNKPSFNFYRITK